MSASNAPFHGMSPAASAISPVVNRSLHACQHIHRTEEITVTVSLKNNKTHFSLMSA
jgi:hypothetical protein